MNEKKAKSIFPELCERTNMEHYRLIRSGTHSEYLRVSKIPASWYDGKTRSPIIKVLRFLGFSVVKKWDINCVYRTDYDRIKKALRYYYIEHIDTNEFLALSKEYGLNLKSYNCISWAKANPDFCIKARDDLFMRCYIYNKRAVQEYVLMLSGKHPKYIKLSGVVNETKPILKDIGTHRLAVARAMIKLHIVEDKLYNKLWIAKTDRIKLINYFKNYRKNKKGHRYDR